MRTDRIGSETVVKEGRNKASGGKKGVSMKTKRKKSVSYRKTGWALRDDVPYESWGK